MKEITRQELARMESVDILAYAVWMRRIDAGTARIIEEESNCQQKAPA
ncbi:MAG: hypothetical protein WC683_04905 [bacterium]